MDRTSSRVLVVSPHDVVRAGVLSVLGNAARLDVRAARVTTASLGWADVVMYDVISLEAGDRELDLILNQRRQVVLAMTQDLRPDLADRAMLRGAHGCVSLAWPASRIAAAVTAAVGGHLRGDGSATSIDYTVNPAFSSRTLAALSRRELEVLRLITTGVSNAEIATALALSINSVKTYIRGAYQKIGVNSRSQAVVWCLNNRIGGPDPDSLPDAGTPRVGPAAPRHSGL